MKVGERGQVTIPKDIRDRFGISPGAEVEFAVEGAQILLRKRPPDLPLPKWKGHCGAAFREAGYNDVDDYIDDVRSKL